MKLYITLAQGIIFVSYVLFLFIKFKKPISSISKSWYLLQGLQKSLFTHFCWTIGVLMLFQTDETTPLFFLSGTGLMFTGTAAAFDESKKSIIRAIHFTGAAMSIFGAFAALYFERGIFMPFALFGISLLLLEDIPNHILWIEISAFVFIFYGLMQ